MPIYCLEYIWIDSNNNLRSKTKMMDNIDIIDCIDVPQWNFDGSSTNQAIGENSDVILRPVKIFNNPFRRFDKVINKLILCDTYDSNNVALPSNKRIIADQIFDKKIDERPWYGLEQEYFILDKTSRLPVGYKYELTQGQFYCGVGSENAFQRKLVETHLEYCIYAGITISGVNAEVAPGQWEFQIGPCEGIDSGDHLWMARYILNRLSEEFDVIIDYSPKPLKGRWNGSGCHTNFSTKNMRLGTETKTGLDYINDAIIKLKTTHKEHMELYGEDNKERMSGEYETAHYDTFTDGISNRGASIRRGLDTVKNKQGYFEDRRPSSNCDPYVVTSKIFKTCILD
jgi:glutamine synthetase